jgi:hypothetical protein
VAARSRRHEFDSKPVRLQGGATGAHHIALLPLGLADCVSQTDRAVIVGHFLPPVGRDVSELSTRVRNSLHFALATALGKRNLALRLRPIFLSCEAANPMEVTLGTNFARALKADAFIAGEVAHQPTRYLMNIYVSDAYGLFDGPELSRDIPVDLDRPSDTEMPGDAYVAVLAALAAGLKRKDDCVNVIEVVSIIRNLVQMLPSYVEDLRKECQPHLPQAGLVR